MSAQLNSLNACKYIFLVLAYRVERSPELDSLEIGDRILEVNGSTVQDKSVQEVSSV